jgi:hypothetical protein
LGRIFLQDSPSDLFEWEQTVFRAERPVAQLKRLKHGYSLPNGKDCYYAAC